MSYIFLSYSRRDSGAAEHVTASLRGAGYRVWIDRAGIAAGDQWRREIVAAIRDTGLFILLLSPNAARSDNVRKELDLAEGSRVRLLPVEIARTEIPDQMKYQLAGLQILRLWREQRDTALLDAVRKYGPPAGRPADPPAGRGPTRPRDSEVDLSHLGGGGFIANWLGKPK